MTTSALPITKVHHIARVTRDAEKSVAFYRDVLGFRELERPGFNFSGGWLYGYDVQIHIIANKDALTETEKEIQSRVNHVAFNVENIELAKQHLEARGIEYKEQVNAGGIHQIFFMDPDGHFIELAEYPPTPPFRD
jgi:glyoxylase I family protein